MRGWAGGISQLRSPAETRQSMLRRQPDEMTISSTYRIKLAALDRHEVATMAQYSSVFIVLSISVWVLPLEHALQTCCLMGRAIPMDGQKDLVSSFLLSLLREGVCQGTHGRHTPPASSNRPDLLGTWLVQVALFIIKYGAVHRGVQETGDMAIPVDDHKVSGSKNGLGVNSWEETQSEVMDYSERNIQRHNG